MEFKYDGGGLAKGAAVALFINDKKVGEGRIDKTEPVRFSANETLDTALDSASPVSTEYRAPFPYTGTLKKVEIDVAPAQLGARDLEELRNAERDTAMAIE
jgi:arylsulfatase